MFQRNFFSGGRMMVSDTLLFKYMMRVFLFIVFGFVAGDGMVHAQVNHYSLNGSVNCESGQVLLMPLIDSSYYPKGVLFKEYPIEKKRFHIGGIWLYPLMVRLGVKVDGELKYVSDYFMVDSGRQSIVCNVDSLREMPKIGNRYMAEIKLHYQPGFSVIDSGYNALERWTDSLRDAYKNSVPDSLMVQNEDRRNKLRNRSKEILSDYAFEHPASYVALWNLVGRLQNGYDSVLERAFDHLSPKLKRSVTGTTFYRKLQQLKVTSVGAGFPKLALMDMDLNPVSLDIAQMGKKYTLVDFWYSHCNPCISQFNDLIALCKNFSPKGFAIVGISIDKRNYISDWRQVIKNHALPWTQFLDLNGKVAEGLAIFACPSNFLCDDKGKIIETDMQPAQLKSFLEARLRD